jgi:hypothetical protein
MPTTIIISTTGQRGALGGPTQILTAKPLFAADVTPTAAWAEVVIPAVTAQTGWCLDVTADVAIRVAVDSVVPSGGTIGWAIPAGQVRALGIFSGDRVFVKTA